MLTTSAWVAFWVALGVVPVVATLVRLFRTLPADQDEVWFLLVATRVARGRRLYAEVFYGAGPLPVWAAAVLVRRRGAGLRALRTTTATMLVVTSVLLLLLVAPAGGPAVVLTAVALAGLVLARSPENTYGVAARGGAVVSVAALAAADPAFVGTPPGDGRALVLALVSGSGLASAMFAKHTIGAAVSLAVLPGWLVIAGPAPAAAATGAAVVGSVAVLGLLARRGELRGFVRRTLTDKGTYLATARLTFTGEARQLATTRPDLWWVDLTAYVVTAAATVGSAIALVMGAPGAVEAAGLAAVSLAGTYPRACPSHLRAGAAPALTSLVVLLAPAPAVLLAVTALLAVLGGVGLAIWWRQPRLAAGPKVDALDGLPMRSPVTTEALADGRRVRELAGRRVLVLRSDAAQWYLALDLRNPTPYDYPLASTFGREGQQAVADRLRPGEVEWCLLAPIDAGALTPHVLVDAVRSGMDPVLDTALGVLHRARPVTRAGSQGMGARDADPAPTVQG